jgi:hypothetical protein
MTKNVKTVIFFTSMKSIMGKGRIAQVGALVLTGFMCAVCSPPPDRIAAPPETSPLSHEAVGYAVISVSYARVLSEPEEEAVSLGVVSGGTVVTVLERRLILKNRTPASGGERSGNTPDPEAAYWLLTEGSHKGWIKAGQAFIYESEEKARTAAAGF